jgi:hypothetical protein
VLSAQRDHYLPLRVIKEHLEAIDRGLEPPALGAGGGPKVPRALVMAEGMPGPDAFLPDVSEIRLSRPELLSAAGLTPEQLDQLEQYGLIAPRQGGSHYDGDALVVAKTVAEMSRFGIEARHLRPFKAAASARSAWSSRSSRPWSQRNPRPAPAPTRWRASSAALSVKLHATLVRVGLGPGLRR